MRISNLVPYDIRPSAFGVMLLMAPINAILCLSQIAQGDNQIIWILGAICFTLIGAVVISVAAVGGRPWWVYYLGTKVIFTDPNKLERAYQFVQENGWHWTKDVADATVINDHRMIMTFRRRDHALMTKLAA